jgi:hypothetical protein
MPDHYCTIEDINGLNPQVPFGPASKPSSVLVEKFIENIAVEIDATLAPMGYVTPVITGSNALNILRHRCAQGALGLAIAVRESGVAPPSEVAKPNLWTQQFEAWLKKLGNPQDGYELPDAPRTSDPLLKSGEDVFRSHVDSDVERFVTSPEITRDQRL